MAGLTLKQAQAKAARLNAVMGITARVVSILGDTPEPDERGHDVEVTVDESAMPSRSMARRIKHQLGAK